jgi:hypothetical protein
METLKLILLLAVLGTLGSAGVLFLWGGFDGRFADEGMISMEGNNEQVFSWLLEPEHRTRWVEGCKSSRRDGIGGWREGARLVETLEQDGLTKERTLKVVEVVVGRSFVLETEEDGVAIRYAFELKAHNTGRASRVEYKIEAQYQDFWGKLLEPLRGGALYARTRRELETLSALHLTG